MPQCSFDLSVMIIVMIIPFCRELEVTHESALRKATQAKLDQFVDMYGDPSVTQELQERLPEAARHEARKQKEREIAALEAGDEKPAL